MHVEYTFYLFFSYQFSLFVFKLIKIIVIKSQYSTTIIIKSKNMGYTHYFKLLAVPSKAAIESVLK